MIKFIKTGFVFYLCLVCFSATAQLDKEPQPEPGKKNIVKLNLSALILRNIAVQYERKIGNKTSVALQVRTIPFAKLPLQSALDGAADAADVDFDKFKFGSFGIVPEFRYYLSKKGALHGFYVGPFVSYSNYKMELPITYAGTGGDKTGIFNGKLNAVTGGLQLGAQFSLGKNVVLDWWILGPNYGSANGTLTFLAGTPLTQSEQNDLRTELEDLKNDAPLNTIKSVSVNSAGASVVAKGPWGGLRGLGINIGIRL